MNTVILPAMTYGAETWSLTKCQKEKLAVAQRSMERLMLNITRKDKIRNKVVRSKTQVKEGYHQKSTEHERPVGETSC